MKTEGFLAWCLPYIIYNVLSEGNDRFYRTIFCYFIQKSGPYLINITDLFPLNFIFILKDKSFPNDFFNDIFLYCFIHIIILFPIIIE